MATQTENGKAFEWAIAKEVEKQTGFPISSGKAVATAQSCFEIVGTAKQQHYEKAALKSVTHILEKESANLERKEKFEIQMATDSEGQTGDVRDVLIVGKSFQFGISCKTNHDALKHSRLSSDIDFVKKWGLSESGCTQAYWDTAGKLFAKLKGIKKDSKGTFLWKDLDDVPKNFYWPILNAFANELELLKTAPEMSQSQLCKKLISYLIGNNDFYKVVASSDQVEIQAFNFQGTLAVQKSKYPSKIVGIDDLNGGQYSKTIRFSEGYTINFRIHNASSRVEPSLKFDVRAIGFPSRAIYTHYVQWK